MKTNVRKIGQKDRKIGGIMSDMKIIGVNGPEIECRRLKSVMDRGILVGI